MILFFFVSLLSCRRNCHLPTNRRMNPICEMMRRRRRVPSGRGERRIELYNVLDVGLYLLLGCFQNVFRWILIRPILFWSVFGFKSLRSISLLFAGLVLHGITLLSIFHRWSNLLHNLSWANQSVCFSVPQALEEVHVHSVWTRLSLLGQKHYWPIFYLVVVTLKM